MTASRPARWLLPLLAASLAVQGLVSAQGYVERALEVGLDHRTFSGFDSNDNPDVPDKAARDWANVGLAVGDLNGDGWQDLVACGALYDNGVYLNQGGTGFVDATEAAGINSFEFDRCAATADYDRDGDVDLFIGTYEGTGTGPLPPHSRLYRNDGTGVFEDVTALAGTVGRGRTLHAYWHDLDVDGWPDLYLSEFNLTANAWYRNNGDHTFTDLAAEKGLDSAGNTHVTSAVDTDEDGFIDVIVANDYLLGAALGYDLAINPGDRYLHGLPDGTFEDISELVNLDTNKGIMGLTFADIDHDGDVDIYKSNIANNILLENFGAPGVPIQWRMVQEEYGVDDEKLPYPDNLLEEGDSVGWGTHFMNADFDRWQDLWVTNGHVAAMNAGNAMPKPQRNSMYLGLGPDGSFYFENKTDELGLAYFNDERGSVLGDFDRDGDMEIVVAAIHGRVHYHENRVDRQGRGWLRVVAEPETSIPHGIGTVVRWTDSEGYVHTRYLGADSPTASQTEYAVEFGMGLEPSADLVVTFPSGIERTLTGLAPNQEVVVTEPRLYALSSTKMPIAASGGSPSSITLTVYAHDATGEPLDETADVQITVSGLLPAAPVEHVAGNEFRRTFLPNNTPGAYRANVSIDGWTPKVRPLLHVHGAPSATASVVELIPEAVRAGSDDTWTVVVAPKDANGLSTGTDQQVVVTTTPPLEPLGPVVAHGDGRYSVTFPAPPAAVTVTPSVTVDGFAITNVPLLEAGGNPNGAMTGFEYEQGHPVQAQSPHIIRVRVTPRDAAGRRLGPNVPVALRVLDWSTIPTGPDAGDPVGAEPSEPVPGNGGRPTTGTHAGGAAAAGGLSNPSYQPYHVWVRDDLGYGQRDGEYVFALERPEEAGNWLADGHVEVLVEGHAVKTAYFTFYPEGGH